MRKLLTALSAMALCALSAFAGDTLTFKISNSRPDADKVDLYLQANRAFLTGTLADKKTSKALEANKTYKLSSFMKGADGSYSFTAAKADSGRLYFSLGTAIPESNGHNWCDPGMDKIRFDWIEFTIDGSHYACANLTSLEQLGIAIGLEAYKDGAKVNSLGWSKSISGVVADSKALVSEKDLPKVLKGSFDKKDFIRLIGPHCYSDVFPKDANPWAPGVAKAITAADGKTFQMTGGFYTPSVRTTFSMSGKFDAATKSITLTGKFNGTKDAVMTVTNLNLESIFAAVAKKGCTVSCTLDKQPQQRNPGDNDVWEVVFNYLVTGFNAGYWCNDATLDTAKWKNATPFSSPDKAYNEYSALIRKNSDSYGDPYSDNEGGKILLTLDPSKVDTLLITILGDDATGSSAAPAKKGVDL